MESISVVTITERDLDDHLEAATSRVFSVQVRPPKGKAAPEAEASDATLGGRRFSYRPLQTMDGGRPGASSGRSKFSLIETIRDVCPRDTLFSDSEHHVLREVRRGVQVFYQVFENYEQASGLDRLKATNKTGKLPRDLEPELRKKNETACAVSVFAGAYFILRKLSSYRAEEVQGLSFEVEEPPDVAVDGQSNAIGLLVWYFVDAIQRLAKDDVSLVKIAVDCARHVCTRIQNLQGSLQYLEFYSRYHYRVEPDDLTISGFDMDQPSASTHVEIQPKRPEEVVGNHIAKFEAMRLAQRLVCYDMARQRNPFVELGGFSFSFIGDGSPGTGKTTLIQMMVTSLTEYCHALGVPFHYLNFSVDEISDYQGRSGQNAKRFCQTVLDPKSIGLGTIDDVDQVCGNRNDKNISAGQLEVTAVLMQELAGPNTVIRGNASFGMFSNYPEKVDDALRQRTQARFLVNGPQTLEDFTDLMYLLLGPTWKLERGAGYEPFSTQQIKEVIKAKYEEHDRPHSPQLAELFDEHAKGGKIETWIEFGHYLKALQDHDERFTGRAVKNISDAVRFRMMDFDLPQEWFENPELFFRQDFDTKLSMLSELRGEITPRIVLQEINRYADSEERYAHAAREREFLNRKQQIVLDSRARLAAAEEELSA